MEPIDGQAKRLPPFSPSRAMPAMNCTGCYRGGNRIEMIFRRLEEWPQRVTGCDRCPTAFWSVVTLAATALYRLRDMRS